MWAQLNEKSLVNANAQFWEQMLNMPMETVPNAESFYMGWGHMQASVRLSGSWTSLIEVRLTEELALAATAVMLMQPPDAVTVADMLDAIREIASMIGVVIKSLLPRPCEMALPESAVAGERMCNEPYAPSTLAVGFRHAQGGLLVRVWEESCSQ